MKRDFLWKAAEVIVPDLISIAVFAIIYSIFCYNPVVGKYWWISGILVASYALYQNIDTIRSKEINTQGA